MRRILIILIVLLLALPLILFAVLNFIPDSLIRERITAAVKEATGRELTIGGSLSKTLFPQIGVSAEAVTLANAEGFNAEAFATMSALEARLALLPLFAGRVEVARFVLVDPSIALEVDRAGRNNWTFASAPADGDAGAPAGETPAAGAAPTLGDVSLGDVKLINGRVSMDNRQTGERWEARDITVAVKLPSLDQPLELDGDAFWKERKVSLDLRADNPRGLLGAAGSPLAVTLAADGLKAAFEGTGSNDKALALAGKADLDIKSLRDVMAWLAEPMAPGQGFGPLAIKGDLALAGDTIDFQNAALAFDRIVGTGAVRINTGGARPVVTGKLAVESLDLNPYLGEPAAPAGGAGGGGGGGGGSASAAGGGWSQEPIDLAGLKALDADLDFQAQEILFQKMRFADSVLDLTIRNGVLTANLSKLALYGGTGRARITVNGAGSLPEIATDLAFSAITIEPLLRDAAAFERLTGTGDLTLSLTGRGRSQQAIAQSLNGRGALKLADGAIKGINLAAMVRNVTGAFTGNIGGADQKTDFAELGGTYTIQNGRLENRDFLLLNPLLRLNGAGIADIGSRTVDYRVVPRAVATIEGQGGKTDLTGVSIPVKITGSWDNLKFAPDPKGLLEGAFKGLGEADAAGEDPLTGALKGLLGRPGAKTPTEGEATPPPEGATSAGAQAPPEGGTPPAEPPPEDPAQQLLKGIFGGQ